MRRCFSLLLLPVVVTSPAAGQVAAERVTRPVAVSGVVFLDGNGNGVRDPDEAGLPGAVVSDQVSVVRTDAEGRFTLSAAGYGLVWLSQPDGYRVAGPFWRRADAGPVTFPVRRASPARSFTFVHASDTHLSEQSLDRMRRFRALVDSLRPDFVLISGDLVRDALRVAEPEARRLYDLLVQEIAAFPVPVYTVPGNHEIFGIERHRSLVSPTNPYYGKRLYRSQLGPNYYSFTWGGVHFLGLDTVDYEDLWYYGHLDSAQVAWVRQDLAALPSGTPVVTFNHIPLVTGAETISGYDEASVAPTVIRLDGKAFFRHSVQNTGTLLDLLGDRLEIALGGHMHRRETITYITSHGARRFYLTAAVVGPPRGDGPLGIRSGITLYRVTDSQVDDGTFIPLDP